jgi:hypothetical protein
MEKLAAKYPDDDEAQIAYAITLNTSASPATRPMRSSSRARPSSSRSAKRQPQHPGVAHYLIHLYDYPAIADKGLEAANAYAKIAPAAPHAQHMPSHIFTRVGYWKESIDSNAASVKAAKADKEYGDQLHGQDYQVYAYLQLGQDKEARASIDEMRRHGQSGEPVGAFATRRRPRATWIERERLERRGGLEVRPSQFAFVQAITHFARALGAARVRQAGGRQGRHRQARRAARQAARAEGRLLGRAGRYPVAGRERLGAQCRRQA